MASSLDFVLFVCEQIKSDWNVRYRKMFGSYMVYINDKPILLVCDDTVYVKILPCLDAVMDSASKGYPYNGAKEHYILDIEDAELADKVISILEPITPIPKPKKKKKL